MFPTIAEGLNFAFATPILLLRWPRFREIEKELNALAGDDGLAAVPWNRLKLESRNQLQRQDMGELSELFGVTVSMAMQMCRTCTGLSPGEAVRLGQAADRGAYRSADTEPPAGGGVGEVVIAIDDAWANGYDAGHFHAPHSHLGALLAAVYVVASVDGPAPEGSLAFMDPRREAVNALRPMSLAHEGLDMLHASQPGDLLLFPGWLTHYVVPHRQAGRRVTISMNLVLRQVESRNGS